MRPGGGHRTRGIGFGSGGLEAGYNGGYRSLEHGSYLEHRNARELLPSSHIHHAGSALYDDGCEDSPEIPPSWVDPRKWDPYEHHAEDWRRPHHDPKPGRGPSMKRDKRYCDWDGPLPPSEQHVHHSQLPRMMELTAPPRPPATNKRRDEPSDDRGKRDERDERDDRGKRGKGGRRGERGERSDRSERGRRRGGRGSRYSGSSYSGSRSGSYSDSRSGSYSDSRSRSSGRGRRRRRNRSRSGSRSGSYSSRSRSRSRSGSSGGSGSSYSSRSRSSERAKAKAQELKDMVAAEAQRAIANAQKATASQPQTLDPTRKTRGIDLSEELLPVPGMQRGGSKSSAAVASAQAGNNKTVDSTKKSALAAKTKAASARSIGSPDKDVAKGPARPMEAPKWKVGKERLEMRKEFNKHEINIAAIMEHYDVNRDGTLEPEEFSELLKDKNSSWWKKKPDQYELACIMALADTDEDENISTGEVLYALKIWFAYNSLSRSAGRLLAPLEQGGRMPNQVLMTEVMTHLNSDYPVDASEVAHVIDNLRFLGATKEKVDGTQLRMAICSWYLNVEREETPHAHLINIAIENTNKKLKTGQYNPLWKCAREKGGDPVTLVAVLVMLGVCVVHPLAEIQAGRTMEQKLICRHWLKESLEFQGVTSLVWFGGLCMWSFSYECCPDSASVIKWVFGSIFAVLSVVGFCAWFIGASQVMASSANDCGWMLWQYANFCFLILPFVTVLFACICVPCMYCCEFVHHKQIESALAEHDNSHVQP